jgi:putative membrane protein
MRKELTKSHWLFTLMALALCGVLGSASAAEAKEAGKKAAPPDDAEIAHIVVTANQVDIDAGKLASEKTKNDEVKKFADQMVADHTAVNKSASDLVQKLGVTPKDNAISKSLKAGGDKNLAKLKKLSGEKFDKAYVDNEVTYHEAVLKTIDDVLLPNAKNAELKATITQVRPTIAEHLKHAQHLQASMPGKKSAENSGKSHGTH